MRSIVYKLLHFRKPIDLHPELLEMSKHNEIQLIAQVIIRKTINICI